MVGLRVLAGLVGLGLAAAECWDENKCIFHQYKDNTNVILYSWDLRSLCNGGAGYTFDNTTNGNKYRFEICGSIEPVRPPYCGALGCISPTLPAQTLCVLVPPSAAPSIAACSPTFNLSPFFSTYCNPE